MRCLRTPIDLHMNFGSVFAMYYKNVLFFLCFATFSKSGKGQEFGDWTKVNDVVYGGPKFVEEGQTFELWCRMSHFNAPKWTKNDSPISDSNRISYDNKIGIEMTRIETLIVTNASATDSGLYRCNSFSRAYHRLDVIASQPIPTFSEPSAGIAFEEIKEEHSEVVLQCKVSPQSDRSEIHWFKNGNKIVDDSHRSVIKTQLVINNATSSADAGDYLCRVDDISERGGSQFGQMIQLRAPIRVRQFPKFESIVNGQSYRLECRYTGYPFGKIKWIIGNKLLTQNQLSESGIQLVANKDSHPNAVLVIRQVNHSHKNSYTCVVNNGYTEDESSIILTVRDNPILANTPTLLLEGKTLELWCNKTENGNTIPTKWQWKKDGTLISELPEEVRNRLTEIKTPFGNTNLQIREAKKEDVGEWSCLDPRDPSAVRTITVLVRPYLLPFENYQKTNYKSANVIEGERFHLRCALMDGYSYKAGLKWYKYNESEQDNPDRPMQELTQDLLMNSRIRINSSNPIDQTLTIDKVEPSDRFFYVCQSHNGHIQFNNTILLRVKDKLGALWPFLGIVAEVIILCTIIFIYEKRRIKPDFDDSDNDNNTDPKSTQDRSSKSQDVRQRK